MDDIVLMGIPADGSRPFIMAYVSSREDAARIYNDTHRYYAQKLSGYVVVGRKPWRRRGAKH